MKAWNTKPQVPLIERIDSVRNWFNSELGRELLAAEQRVVDHIMPSLFGYHMLQVGVHAESDLLAEACGGHKFALVPRIELGMEKAGLVGRAEELPFANECIDAVVLHHALDFAESPHQVLREAARVLRPGGKLVVVGFNPLSFWGVSRLFRQRKAMVPWGAHFLSARRLHDWFTLLELKPDRVCSGFYRPPVSNPNWRRRLEFIERWGERYHTNNGAFVILLACKESLAATPVGRTWRRRLVFPVANRTASRAGRQVARAGRLPRH